MSDANEFLMSGGITSAKFPQIGAKIAGVIDRAPEKQQRRDFATGNPLFWDDGRPQEQLKVVLATSERDPDIEDDDGLRAVYIKGQLIRAIREAVKKAHASGLEPGGHLEVTYVSDGEAKKGFNPPKNFAAIYAPPNASGDFLATDEPAQASGNGQPSAPRGLTQEAYDALPDEVKALLAQR